MAWLSLLVCVLCGCAESGSTLLGARQVPASGDGQIVLSNEAVRITFSEANGEVTSLTNIAFQGEDGEYMWNSPGHHSEGHGLFLAWVNAPEPPVALNPPWAGASFDPVLGLPGGGSFFRQAISTAQCELISHSRDRIQMVGSIMASQLSMTMVHGLSGLRFDVMATLADGTSPELNLTLRVSLQAGLADITRNLSVAFPFLSGISLGMKTDTNLGIRHFETGLPGEAAWSNPGSGGLYGLHTSQLWQSVWEPSTGAGLALIVMDDRVFHSRLPQRIIMRFLNETTGTGTIFHTTYPAVPLTIANSGSGSVAMAPVQLLVHSRGWRVAARAYGKWLRSVGVGSRPEPRWLASVHSKGSAWIPPASAIAASRKRGEGFTNFTQLYDEYYASNTVDMIEFAMWWDGVTLDDGAGYGSCGADGVFQVRADCGGVAALRIGVDRIHAMGRRIQLYVSGDIVNLHTQLFNASSPWQRWAKWPDTHEPKDPHGDNDVVHMCHAFSKWQEDVATFTARVIELTGVDGVRLDGVGMLGSPCFNKDHHHISPYETQGVAGNLEMLARTRAAVDAIGGHDAILSTENYFDVFRMHFQGALLMWYPGRDINAARVMLPEYQASAYHGGEIETALNGWIPSGSQYALRKSWPYASDCDKQPTYGFPGRPCNYPTDGGRKTKWSELRETFVAAVSAGNVTLSDPHSPSDPEFNARLYYSYSPPYWLLIAARWNGSMPVSPTEIKLPPGEVSGDVSVAVEVDAYTLGMSDAKFHREGDAATVTVQGGFSAVLLPRPGADGLLVMKPVMVQPVAADGSNSSLISFGLHSFWQTEGVARKVNVTVSPGLVVSSKQLTLPATLSIRARVGVKPGYFMLNIRGDGILPTRRWVEVVPSARRWSEFI